MDGIFISLIPVSMGNPHAVIFVDDIKTAPLIAIGPRIERHEAFPDGVNVEFVEIISKTNCVCAYGSEEAALRWYAELAPALL